MKNLIKTIIFSITIIATVTFGTISTEAKEYKAGNTYINVDKPGVRTVINTDYVSLYAGNSTIYYSFKATSNVKSVKAPTMSSKKIHSYDSASFKITKDSVVKFKAIKGNATTAKFKKAKTYYVVVKVEKSTDFFKEAPATVMDKGEQLTYKLNRDVCDDVKVYFNGKKAPCYGAPTKDNTNVKMVFYKYGKKVGTKSFTVTWKKYTNKVTNPYHLPEWSYIFAVPTASTDKELEMEVSCKGADLTKGEDAQRTGRLMQSIVTVKQYQKVYYKENGKFVQCGRQLYSTETKKYNTGLPVKKVYTDKCYAGYCLTEEEHPGITGMRITYVDTDGYLVSEVVAPGERMKGEMMYGAYFEFQIAGEWHFTTDRARCEAFKASCSGHHGTAEEFLRTLKGEKVPARGL